LFSGLLHCPRTHRLLPELLAVLLLVSAVPFAVPQARASTLVPHSPIIINGDSDFTAANGVIDGRGTRSHPYLIEGWNITASSWFGPNSPNGPGIIVNNTTAYFVIRNVISNEGAYPGLKLTHVANAAIENSQMNGYPWTAVVDSSRNIRMTNNGYDPNFNTRILVTNSVGTTVDHNKIFWMLIKTLQHLAITNNDIGGVGCPLCIEGSSDVLISGNTLPGCDCVTLSIGSSDHVTLSKNSIGGDYPLLVRFSSFVTISDNKIDGGVADLMDLNYCTNVSVRGNQFRGVPGTDYGLRHAMLSVYACGSMDISGNTFAPPGLYHGNFNLIDLTKSQNMTITANYFASSVTAVNASDSSSLLINENVVYLNSRGVALERTINTRVFHNNFLNNTVQAFDDHGTNNTWDDGSRGGNYWTDYNRTSADHNGIGDTPYVFNYNQDNFPFLQPLKLPVTGPRDFQVTANPTSFTVKAGVTANSTITVTTFNGFTDPITLTITPSSAFLTCTISPGVISGGSGTAILSCHGGNPSNGPVTFYVRVDAAGGGSSRYAYVQYTVTLWPATS
jgi:nitrous oxidase accessory protein NosD